MKNRRKSKNKFCFFFFYSEINTSSANTSVTSSNSDSGSSSSAASSTSSSSSTDQESDQISRSSETLSAQIHRKMLQMAAQIQPNHPTIQKLAQRLIVDQPKSPTEAPPATSTSGSSGSESGDEKAADDDDSPSTTTKSTNFKFVHQSDMNSFTLSNHVLSTTETDTDFVDISRALREAVHDFRPDLNASEIVQVLQPISNLIPSATGHKSGSINNIGQQFTIQQGKSQHNQGK